MGLGSSSTFGGEEYNYDLPYGLYLCRTVEKLRTVITGRIFQAILLMKGYVELKVNFLKHSAFTQLLH